MEEANKATTPDTKEVKNDKIITPPKDDKSMPEWLTPILSALGGMGGSYLLSIKPMQARMDIIASQLIDLRAEVKELKHQNKELEKSLGDMEKKQSSILSNALSNTNTVNELPAKQASGQVTYIKKHL